MKDASLEPKWIALNDELQELKSNLIPAASEKKSQLIGKQDRVNKTALQMLEGEIQLMEKRCDELKIQLQAIIEESNKR